MKLDDYLNFISPDDIRVRGTRVGIETILFDYLGLGLFPEDIAARYPTLTLEQVYATITYYWSRQAEVDVYLQACREHEARMRREQQVNPSPAVKRLREMVQQRQAVTFPPSPSP